MQFELLTRPTHNPKAAKSMAHGTMTFPLHLAPADTSGLEVCPGRSEGCSKACLNTAGRGGLISAQTARIRKTQWYFEDRAGFMNALVRDIVKAITYAERKGYKSAFRLNATSDIPWHRIPVPGSGYWGGVQGHTVMQLFPHVQFYDYTKVAKRLTKEQLPGNYHLTYSLAEDNRDQAIAVLESGHNVAAVFRTKAMVQELLHRGEWGGFPVIDGDETDQRYLDPRGVVVALYAKGQAKHDTSGFVKDL
jgi:hypothetical protein